jgi:hypothetical protein
MVIPIDLCDLSNPQRACQDLTPEFSPVDSDGSSQKNSGWSQTYKTQAKNDGRFAYVVAELRADVAPSVLWACR